MTRFSLLFWMFYVLASLWIIPSVRAQTLSASVGGISTTPTSLSPAAVFWNPAIIGRLSGTQFETNLTLLGGWLIYDREGTDPNTNRAYDSSEMSAIAPNPFFSINSDLGRSDFRFGYATYFPAGVMASFDPNGSQRYSLIEGVVIPWQHQLTVAYRPNSDWSFAAAGIYSLGFFKSQLDIDLESFLSQILNSEDIPKEHPALSARANIPMTTAHAFGGAFGVHYSPSFQWGFGLSFFLPVEYSFVGRCHISTPKAIGTLSAGLRALGVEDTIESEVEVTSTIPPFLQTGISYQPYGYYMAEIFGRYTFSSLYPSLAVQLRNSPIVTVKDYSRPGKTLNDTFLVGMVHTLSLWQHWALGLNTTYASNAVQNAHLSTSLADFDTLLVGPFAQYSWSQHLRIGAEFAHSFMFERETHGTVESNTIPNAIFKPASSDGTYRAAADRFGIMVKYGF